LLTVINKVDVESTFNARSPKPFIDRVEVTEVIDEISPSTNSSIIVNIDSHLNDISLGDDEFAILDNTYLLENLYVHFLLVKSSHYEDFNTDNFYKLSQRWQQDNLSSDRIARETFKLSELFNFDTEEDREELSKSIRFENSDSDIYVLPFQTVRLEIPVVYSSEGTIFDDNVYLISYLSPDEDELNEYTSLSLKEKNYLNSFFSGVNFVELIKDQDINDQKLAYYNESDASYWQTDVIKDSNGRIFGAQTFSSREILTKYYEFVLNKEREVAPSERIRMKDLFVELKTSFFLTRPDIDCVANLKAKVNDLVKDYAGSFEELTIINSTIKFLNGVDQQLSLLPLLESRTIGDIRIQRQTLNFLEGIEIGLSDQEMLQKQILITQSNLFSDFFYTSDDDGSVEAYLLVNKTNMMKKYSTLIERFPNLRTYVPEIDSFFGLSSVELYRGDVIVEPGGALYGMSSINMNTLIGTFKFEVDDSNDKNKNISFLGNFIGQREILELQQQDVTVTDTGQTVTETVQDSTSTDTQTSTTESRTTRTISEAVKNTIEVGTNGFATALAHFDSNADEIIMFCINDQSVNASTGQPIESIVMSPEGDIDADFTIDYSKTEIDENGNASIESYALPVDQMTDEVYDEFSETLSAAQLYLGYKIDFTAMDNSAIPLLSLFEDLQQVVEELELYEIEANEKCSFNDIAFKFNDYFIDQQYRKYPVLSQAPWNKLSSALALHATLFNKNQVLQNEITFNANQIKRKLDPKSASLYSIGLVLSASKTMLSNIENKLVSLGAIRYNSGVGRYVSYPLSVRKEYPEVFTVSDKLYAAKLSQYDGITQLEPVTEVSVETTFIPPSLDTLLGQFVTKLKPAINKLYTDSNVNLNTYSSKPGSALHRLNWFVINNRDSLKNKLGNNDLDDSLDSRGRMKLNMIAPYRNTKVIDQEFGWNTKSMKIKGRFEAVDSGAATIQGTDEYNIDLSNFYRQRLEFRNNNRAASALQRMTYLNLASENFVGGFFLPTGRIITSTGTSSGIGSDIETSQRPEYQFYSVRELLSHCHYDHRSDDFLKNEGWGENLHHIIFYYNGNNVSHKCAHNDYNSGDTRDFLNEFIFKRQSAGGSDVNDRDSLRIKNTSEANNFYNKDSLRQFKASYLIAFAEVFSEIDFLDGEGYHDTTELFVNGNEEDHLFVRLYRSGFYPWPGFPGLPDSIEMTLDEFLGN